MIDSFKGQYSFLSNFYCIDQIVGGIVYPSNEHFFHACKTQVMEEQNVIRTAPTPAIAKKMASRSGYRLPNGKLFKITLRPDWNSIRVSVMQLGVEAKFSQNLNIHNALMATGSIQLVEDNYWHDNFWGNCLCSKCMDIPGLNNLGKLLMFYRTMFGRRK